MQRYDIPNGDGTFTERYWKPQGSPVLDEAGELRYIIHAPVEVTEQVKAEKTEQAHQELIAAYRKIEESEKKYRSLFESIDQGFCLVELIYDESGAPVDHLFLETNHLYEAQTGLIDVHGKTARQVAPGIEARWFKLYDQVVQSGKPFRFTEESKALERWFDVYVYPAGDVNAKRVAVLFTDITERKKMELALKESETQLQAKVEERTLELQEKNQELKRSNSNLEEFAYAASHDMKEPIRKIHFFADRLKAQLQDQLNEEQKRSFERLELASKRMGTLIDDLLDYSQATKGIPHVVEVDLNKEVRLVLEDLELELEQKRAQVTVDHLPEVKGNKRQFQQLFHNLISNALKYSKAQTPPEVHISCRETMGGGIPMLTTEEQRNGKYYLIEVRDNGIGFAQEDARRIFNVFTRLHGNAEYRGTGVGLSIAQKVVQNHGGHIWAKSTPGEGATFFIALPK